jgi:SPP1 gp7 family putative phage head morphogenesis protein
MAKPRPSETVGGPSPRGLELELRRALKPMIMAARSAARRIRTAEQARALGVALRRAWPDKRIAAIVGKVMRKAEQRAGAGWGKWERKVSHRLDRTGRMDAKFRGNIGDFATWPDLGDLVARSVSSTYDNARKVTVIEWELADGSRLTTIGLPKGIRKAEPWAKLKAYDAALEAGTNPAELAARWAAEGIPGEGRLKVIAQHQIANLHAAVQAERAKAIGAEEGDWITQEDDKVRPEHRKLHGRRFKISEGIDGVLPGQPVNCRCYMSVVIPDELLLSFEVGSAFDT